MPFIKRPKKVKDPEDVEHAYQYSLFVLNLRLRTAGEMRDKMQQRGYSAETIDTVVQQLTDERLIDDSRYAEIFIENMKLYKYYGFFQMKKKLFSKKLPKDLIDEKLADLVTADDEKEIAQRFLKREIGETKAKSLPLEERQRLMRRLVARGFRTDVIMSLI